MIMRWLRRLLPLNAAREKPCDVLWYAWFGPLHSLERLEGEMARRTEGMPGGPILLPGGFSQHRFLPERRASWPANGQLHDEFPGKVPR